MKPILMKGHERPLTFLRYNKDGDLLVSCSKDSKPTLWYSNNGEKVGTFNGHKGAVSSCDISRDSTQLITASADSTVKLWDVKTGTQLYTYEFTAPARSVEFSIGDKLAVITTDPFMESPSTVYVKRVSMDSPSSESLLEFTVPQGRINRAVWGHANKTIITAGEDGVVRLWDSETGKLLKESDDETSHAEAITDLKKSEDLSYFLTGSIDKSAKLWDTRTLTVIKTYVGDRPLNAVAISPIFDQVIVGGGQDPSDVTRTDHRAGKFETKFFDKVLEEVIGTVKGHFGPVNALAFNPDGRSFVNGGEDGYVRLHHFDDSYFKKNKY